MYKSAKKLLVSGCGITYSKQSVKTWVNILRLTGVPIIDVSGPAVSNQWIINRAFLKLQEDPEINKVIIQLTAIGKLDVEVDEQRQAEMVTTDSLRNFTIDGIWPSSTSSEHPAKSLWSSHLFSPTLEKQDLFCKLVLLNNWCTTHNIDLVVIQGYNLYWNDTELFNLRTIIYNLDHNIMDRYKQSKWWNGLQQIDVPALPYQFELAIELSKLILPEYIGKLEIIKNQFIDRL